MSKTTPTDDVLLKVSTAQKKKLGRLISKNRLRLGLTQVDLSKLSNTSQSSVNRCEQGKIEGITLFCKLMLAMGIEPDITVEIKREFR